MALNDVKVGKLEARLTDEATYTYDVKIDIVDTAGADLASRSDDWTTDPREMNMRLTFGGSKKWENGNWHSKSFAGYGARESFLITASDGTKKKKGQLVNLPSNYPSPPSGVPAGSGTDGSTILAQLILDLIDEDSSANEYTLAIELAGGAPVKMGYAENSDLPGSKVIVAITGLVNSSSSMVIDFDDPDLEREGVAIFIVDSAEMSGNRFSKNTKDGMIFFKANV